LHSCWLGEASTNCIAEVLKLVDVNWLPVDVKHQDVRADGSTLYVHDALRSGEKLTENERSVSNIDCKVEVWNAQSDGML
jgi:uncharacterized cysteine cluster protein YcgN (CxxCxxCC family)